MSDNKQFQARAQAVFQTVCRALDAKHYPYQVKESGSIICAVSGASGVYPLTVTVHANRQMLSVVRYADFTVPEDKSMDMVLSICHINRKMADGCFDFSLTDGNLLYRMTHSFADMPFSEEMALQIIVLAGQAVAMFEPSLKQVAEETLTVAQLTAM